MHLPPTSTLFPYTTLFRSRQPDFKTTSHCFCEFKEISIHKSRNSYAVEKCKQHKQEKGTKPPNIVYAVCISLRDRKSTRLNSSHVSISYAVFCLKKNTIKY